MAFQHSNNRGRSGGRSFMSNRSLIRIVIAAIVAICAWLAKDKLPSKDNSHSGKHGEFTAFFDCSLVDHRSNDGDSFFVQHGGKQVEYRLYYVDCPESKDWSYNNHQQRLKDQGKALGGLNKQETLKRGQDAKKFTIDLLKSNPFDVYTIHEKVFNSEREYAFIKVKYEGKPQWLHEILVENELARVHTKGMVTPDGTPYQRHKKHLLKLSPTQ